MTQFSKLRVLRKILQNLGIFGQVLAKSKVDVALFLSHTILPLHAREGVSIYPSNHNLSLSLSHAERALL